MKLDDAERVGVLPIGARVSGPLELGQDGPRDAMEVARERARDHVDDAETLQGIDDPGDNFLLGHGSSWGPCGYARRNMSRPIHTRMTAHVTSSSEYSG